MGRLTSFFHSIPYKQKIFTELCYSSLALAEPGYEMSLQSKSKVTEKIASSTCEIVTVWGIMKLVF